MIWWKILVVIFIISRSYYTFHKFSWQGRGYKYDQQRSANFKRLGGQMVNAILPSRKRSYAYNTKIIGTHHFIYIHIYFGVSAIHDVNTHKHFTITLSIYDDVIKWKHFPRYWPFVRGIHWSPVDSPHNDQWRGALMFSLICAWAYGGANYRDVGDLKCHRAHYDVFVIFANDWTGKQKGWIYNRRIYQRHLLKYDIQRVSLGYNGV